MKNMLKFRKSMNLKRFRAHNKNCFAKFIAKLNHDASLPMTEEGVKFSTTNGYVVFTNYRECESTIKTASILFLGKRGTATVTLYDGPIQGAPKHTSVAKTHHYSLVQAPSTIIPQIKQTIQNFLN